MVDFPTPPLPEDTTITFLIRGCAATSRCCGAAFESVDYLDQFLLLQHPSRVANGWLRLWIVKNRHDFFTESWLVVDAFAESHANSVLQCRMLVRLRQVHRVFVVSVVFLLDRFEYSVAIPDLAH